MCKFQEYNDLNQEICLHDGKLCCEGDCFVPSEYDVINGYFEDDPAGLRRWIWNNKGCPKCKSKLIVIEDEYYYSLAKCLNCKHEEELD